MDTSLFEEIFLLLVSKKEYESIIKSGKVQIYPEDEWTGSFYIAFFSKRKKELLGICRVEEIQRVDQSEDEFFLEIFLGKPFLPKKLVLGTKGKKKYLKKAVTWEEFFVFSPEDFFLENKKEYMFITVSDEFQKEYGLPSEVPVISQYVFQNIGTSQIPLEAIVGGIELYLKDNDANLSEEEKGKYVDFLKNVYLDYVTDNIKYKKFRLSEQILYKLLELLPEDALIYYYLGYLYFEWDELKKASKNLLKSIDLNPNDHLPYTYLGLVYAKQNKFSKAIEVWKKSLELGSDDPNLHGNIARCYLNLKDYEKAIYHFEKAIQQDDSDIENFNYLALGYANTGNLDKAILNWTRVLNLGGGDGVIYYNLARAYYELSSYSLALYFFEKSLATMGSHDESFINYVEDKIEEISGILEGYRKGELQAYISFLEKEFNIKIKGWTENLNKVMSLVEVENALVGHLHNRLDLLSELIFQISSQDKVEVEEEGKLKISLNKKHFSSDTVITSIVLTLLKEGIDLLIQQNKKHKIKVAQQEIRKNILKEETQKVKEEDEDEENEPDFESAIEDVKRRLKDDPENEWLHYTLGSIYAQKGDLDNALEEFQLVLKLNPDNGLALHSCGSIYNKKGMEDKALEYYKKAIVSKVTPDLEEIYKSWNYSNAYAYFDIADIYMRKGKWDEAIFMFEKGLSINMKVPLAYYHLGTCYLQKNNLTKSLEAFKKATLLKQDFAAAYNRMGYIYFQLEKWEEALDNFKKAYKYVPNDLDTIFYLGQLYFLLGNYEDAKKYLLVVVNSAPGSKYSELAENLLQKLEKK
jgi:superkiller protein 3